MGKELRDDGYAQVINVHRNFRCEMDNLAALFCGIVGVQYFPSRLAGDTLGQDALLVEEGRLDLDVRARSIAPEFPLPEATVRDLLAHAAALPDYDAFTDLLEAGPVTTANLLRAASARGVPP